MSTDHAAEAGYRPACFSLAGGYEDAVTSPVLRRAVAVAPVNIALVKYWGKRDSELNLRATRSLSVTLKTLATTTRVELHPDLDGDELLLNGASDEAERRRVTAFLAKVRRRAGREQPYARVVSDNG